MSGTRSGWPGTGLQGRWRCKGPASPPTALPGTPPERARRRCSCPASGPLPWARGCGCHPLSWP
eukprot:8692482-Lingulodinium_polyedra.AAC.1